MSDDTLFHKGVRFGPAHVLNVTVFAGRPNMATIELFSNQLAIGSLYVEQLDEAIDVLKQARRAIRHAAWKAGNTGAMNGPAQPVSDEEHRRAAQTDPEWAKRMLADPPRPVNEAIREDIEREEPAQQPPMAGPPKTPEQNFMAARERLRARLRTDGRKV